MRLIDMLKECEAEAWEIFDADDTMATIELMPFNGGLSVNAETQSMQIKQIVSWSDLEAAQFNILLGTMRSVVSEIRHETQGTKK